MMANECTKCGSKDNYNFALNIGLCNVCIINELERIKELEEAIEKAIPLICDDNDFVGLSEIKAIDILVQALKGAK